MKKELKSFLEDENICNALDRANIYLKENGVWGEKLKDIVVSALVLSAENICKDVVSSEDNPYQSKDRKIDRFLTSKTFGYPVMILLLGLIFWITISGANYPSALLSDFFMYIQNKLTRFSTYINAPEWLYESLVLGVWRTLSWVVAVMLPDRKSVV